MLLFIVVRLFSIGLILSREFFWFMVGFLVVREFERLLFGYLG